VDPSPTVRAALRESARNRGYDVVEAEGAATAVEAVRNHRPDLVLLSFSDDVSGSPTIQEIRDEDPSTVVVLLVERERATDIGPYLELGAVNVLGKPLELQEVEYLLNEMYLVVEEEADIRQVLHMVASRRTRLRFPGTPSHLGRIVAFLGREVRNSYPGLRVPVAEIKLALYEALANAIEHGNLEIDYDTKTRALDGEGGGLEPLVQRRMSDPRFQKRKIWLEVDYFPDRVVYRVRDEGAGFSPSAHGLRALADTTALHGRGIALIQNSMDRVWWNPRGNEIRMMRRILQPRSARRRRAAEQRRTVHGEGVRDDAGISAAAPDRPGPAGTARRPGP
jgi:DNA-binding response OmpR family regulator